MISGTRPCKQSIKFFDQSTPKSTVHAVFLNHFTEPVELDGGASICSKKQIWVDSPTSDSYSRSLHHGRRFARCLHEESPRVHLDVSGLVACNLALSSDLAMKRVTKAETSLLLNRQDRDLFSICNYLPVKGMNIVATSDRELSESSQQ